MRAFDPAALGRQRALLHLAHENLTAALFAFGLPDRPSDVLAWEEGRRVPSIDALLALAALLAAGDAEGPTNVVVAPWPQRSRHFALREHLAHVPHPASLHCVAGNNGGCERLVGSLACGFGDPKRCDGRLANQAK